MRDASHNDHAGLGLCCAAMLLYSVHQQVEHEEVGQMDDTDRLLKAVLGHQSLQDIQMQGAQNVSVYCAQDISTFMQKACEHDWD